MISINEGEMASRARRGDGLHKWVNCITPGATATVLTDATLCYNIPEGKQVFIRKGWTILNVVSNSCKFNLVSCDEVDGGGDVTDIDGTMLVHSGTEMYGSEHYERDYRIPLVARYSEGARCISVKVDAHDASTDICCGWNGWVEDEV